MLIKDVKPIKQSYDLGPDYFYLSGSRDTILKDKTVLKLIVDEACLAACEYLYDCNIRTMNSSANEGNYVAYITIDFSSLSEENKAIYYKLVEMGILKREELEVKEGLVGVNIEVPLTEASTVEEVSQKLESIAKMFMPQDILYGYLTEEQIRNKIIDDLENNRGYTDLSLSVSYFEYITNQIREGKLLPCEGGEVEIDNVSYSLEEIISLIKELPICKDRYYYDDKEGKYWLGEGLYEIHRNYLKSQGLDGSFGKI